MVEVSYEARFFKLCCCCIETIEYENLPWHKNHGSRDALAELRTLSGVSAGSLDRT